ncbi:MAG TPA: hypothetical protein VKD90_23205 [Gemmataceae bacterium]|nr:hypothetical protein [Gemmataceae bacterium]
MATNDTDNGWDSLAEEFGLEAAKEPPKAEKPAPPQAARPAPQRRARDPRPEVEGEADDFGSGLAPEPQLVHAPLYDPGPAALAEEYEDEVTAEPVQEAEEGEDDSPPTLEPVTDGGKKRRRRRRRRKKGGAPEAAEVEPEAPSEAAEQEEDGGVEEGEAPAEVEGDDSEEATPSAVDEEMEAEAAVPRNEWHVMTWHELVAKLYRPG